MAKQPSTLWSLALSPQSIPRSTVRLAMCTSQSPRSSSIPMRTVSLSSLMMMMLMVLSWLPSQSTAFAPPLPQTTTTTTTSSFSSLSSSPLLRQRLSPLGSSSSGQDYVDQMSDEEKANMFQVMLRDLQIEGTPLLDCDADQVHTLQTALWTTMAELCDQDDAQKVCLVLSSIPIAALQSFVNDFFLLKMQNVEQMKDLPELDRLTASVLGKGVGPAIVLEVSAKNTNDKSSSNSDNDAAAAAGDAAAYLPSKVYNEFACAAAHKGFVERVVRGSSPSGNSAATIGLGDEGLGPGDAVYRFTNQHSVCNIMAFFWNCVCEVLVAPETDVPNMVLQLPAIEKHARFAAITHLLSRSLCLYQGDAVLSLVHFHPEYQRDEIDPADKPAFGHLPPTGWVQPMMRAAGMDDSVLTESNKDLLNYQHRAPVCAVHILRNNLLGDPKVVDIVLDDGTAVQASGLETYATNAEQLVGIGDGPLREALTQEVNMANSV